MHLATLALLLPVASLANPLAWLEERAAPNLSGAIIKNLTETFNDVKTLNTTLNSFGNNQAPDFFTAIALQDQGNAIEADLNSTIATAQKSSPFTAAQSTQIYNKINTQTFPATQQLLNNFIRHYPGLQAGGEAPLVHDALVRQRDLVKKQSTVLTNKSTGPSKDKAPALTQKFVAAFNNAITKYANA